MNRPSKEYARGYHCGKNIGKVERDMPSGTDLLSDCFRKRDKMFLSICAEFGFTHLEDQIVRSRRTEWRRGFEDGYRDGYKEGMWGDEEDEE